MGFADGAAVLISALTPPDGCDERIITMFRPSTAWKVVRHEISSYR
jgi:hypothetical protein